LKKWMRRILVFIMVATMALMTVCCGEKENTAKETKEKKIKIVTTIFPEYDWVRELLGERIDDVTLTLLQKEGMDLHSYQPSVWDMAKIADCDLFIYLGGSSDEWVKRAMVNSTNKNQQVLNLMDILGDDKKEEELVKGMQEEQEDLGDTHGGDDTELDEHIWLSLKNARKLTKSIKDALIKIDSGHETEYEKNGAMYDEKLDALDKEYRHMVEEARRDTLVFGDRFPFRYLTDDYDLTYYAAFPGCSGETEASFETVVFLANKVDELGIKDILVLENADGKVAASIKNSTKEKNHKIRELNSMQSVKEHDIDAGETYLGIMEQNLTVLKTALYD